MNQRIVDSSRRRRERSKRHARMALAARPLEALEARSLLSQVFTVTNTSDNTSMGSLRWAIGQVNSDGTDTPASPDQIHFNIPTTDPGFDAATGVWTIAPATALPNVGAPCIIDGYTQTGAAANTSATADNAVIKIELDGGPTGDIQFGLQFVSGSGSPGDDPGTVSGVEGLAIHSFDADVNINASGIFVQGCFIGTNAAGAAPAGRPAGSNAGAGVVVSSGAFDVIGGTDPADRDLISNCGTGVVTNAGGELIAGDLIGTDPTGTAAVPNGDGIVLQNAGDNTVGGTTAGARNVISGNDDDGIDIEFDSDDSVEGNYIGTDVTGTRALGNGLDGILVDAGVANTVGGTTPAAANVISGNGTQAQADQESSAGVFLTGGDTGGSNANLIQGNLIGTDATGTGPLGNTGNGILIDLGDGNAFLDNIIAFNTKIGIDLVGGTEDSFGVTANSPGGPHEGPNDLQNYPVLTSAVASAGQTVITGTLNSEGASTFQIDLYAVPTADPSGHGQALTFLGSTTVETDDDLGDGSFTFTVPRDLLGQQITALATILNTDANPPLPGSTSEFSADIPVTTTAAPSADLAAINSSATPNPVQPGGEITYTFTITDLGPDAAQAVAATVGVPLGTTFVSLAQSSPFFQFQAPPVGGGSGTTITLRAPSASSPNEPVTLTLVVQVDPGAAAGTIISDTAVVASLTPDPNTANNTATASATVAAPPVTATLTTLTPSSNPSTVGQPVLFSAVITPDVPMDGPTGTVVFLVDGTPAATAPVGPLPDGGPDAGLATFLDTTLTPGSHTVVAQYSGDASFAPSTSATVVETVTPPVPPPPPPPPPFNPAPSVVQVLRYGYHALPTALAVVFDSPLDPASATNVTNYVLVGPRQQVIPIVSAALLPGNEGVVLQPMGRLNVHWTYTLTVIGTPPSGVTGSTGTYIGSNPVETITLRNLVWRRPLPGSLVSRYSPSAKAVDAVLAAEYRAELREARLLARHR